MPIFKNAIRQKSLTLSFDGISVRETDAKSFTLTGVIQDLWSGIPAISGVDADDLPLRIGGTDTRGGQIVLSPGTSDGWTLNYATNTTIGHEYSAEDRRDLVLTALQNNTWFNSGTGLDFTATPLGTFSATTGTNSLGNTTYDILWTPNAGNTAAFADDHPGTTNNDVEHYVPATTAATGDDFATNFEPEEAFYDATVQQVELTFASTSSANDNKYWAAGRRFGTDNVNGSATSPLWIGEVIEREVLLDGKAVVTLAVLSGKDALDALVVAYSSNNILQAFITGSQFVVQASISALHMLDQVATDNEGYTTYGYVTKADWLGPIAAGTTAFSRDQTGVEIDFSSTLVTANNRNVNLDFPANVIGTVANIAFNSSTGVTAGSPQIIGPFGGRMFIQCNAAQSQADKVTDWIAALENASTATLGGEVSDTLQMRLYYKDDTTNVASNPVLGTNQFGAVINATQPIRSFSGTEEVLLTIATDPNRTEIGNGLGVVISGTATRDISLASDNGGQLPFITFGRGSEMHLDNGFILNVSAGYEWLGDGKDVIVRITDNASLVFDTEQRKYYWGPKSKWAAGGVADGTTPIRATAANPCTLQISNNGQIALGSVTVDHIINSSKTNEIYGSRIYVRSGFYRIITENALIGVFGGKKLADPGINPNPGSSSGEVITLDTGQGADVVYQIDPFVKQFSGPKIVLNEGDFSLNGAGGASSTQAAAYDYGNACWVVGGINFTGPGASSFGGYQPRDVDCIYFNPQVNSAPYYGTFTWAAVNSVKGSGATTLSILWNPQWTYGNAPITKINESYYYGANTNATLVPVKEGVESAVIGTVGTQNHPFNDAVSISSTAGLAEVGIDADGINLYKSDNTNSRTGWGDMVSDYDGLALSFLREANDASTGGRTTKPYQVDSADEKRWFSYTRRDGYRPYFTNKLFDDAHNTLNPVTPMEPFLDPYWQTAVVSEIDALIATQESTWVVDPFYTAASTELRVDSPVASNWNDIYRHIEYSENNNLISNAKVGTETRVFSTINGAFRRFIDPTTQVTPSGEINMPDYSLEINIVGGISRSTALNGIRGIDLGNTNSMEFTSAGAVANVIEGDFTAKDYTFTTTTIGLSAMDSTFNNTDAQTYPIALSNSTVNSVGAPTFSGVTDVVAVNTNATTTISAAATDLTLVGTGAVTVSANTTECKFGSESTNQSGITYSSSSVSHTDIGHTSAGIVLSNSVTDGFFKAGSTITSAGTGGTWSNTNAEAVTSIASNALSGGTYKAPTIGVTGSTNGSVLDGADVDVSVNMVGGEVKNATTTDVVGNVTGVEITSSTSATIGGNSSENTIATPDLDVTGTSTNDVVTGASDIDIGGTSTGSNFTSSATITTTGNSSTTRYAATGAVVLSGTSTTDVIGCSTLAIAGNVDGDTITATSTVAIAGVCENSTISSTGVTLSDSSADNNITSTGAVVIGDDSDSDTISGTTIAITASADGSFLTGSTSISAEYFTNGTATAPVVSTTGNVTGTNVTASTSLTAATVSGGTTAINVGSLTITRGE